MRIPGRGKPPQEPDAPPAADSTITSASPHGRSSLVAAAARINLEGQGWRTWKFGDDSWQQEAWRLYDIVGELRFVANWIGSACSRVRIYVAEVDENGRVQQEVKDTAIAALADTLFGSPAAKAEALRMLGINLTIAGDAYIIGRDTGDATADDWVVVSSSELKRSTPNGRSVTWLYADDDRRIRERLDPKKTLIIRVWTPHPRRNLWADSPTRAALPMLWEIERLTRYVFAQIDSRLVSAGLLPIPSNISFPDEDPELPGAEQLAARLMRIAAMSLKHEGTAAGVVPTIVEVPPDALGKINLVQFGSELSRQALDLRAEALRRFALAMDIDPAIVTGVGEANHWGAWQIVAGQIKVHIEPLMSRICDALTTAYLHTALRSLGKDPERYVFHYDTAPLVVRPERLKETREMYDKGLVSHETVLLAGDYPLSAAPSKKEDMERFIRELLLRDPALFQFPPIRKLAGFGEDAIPANTPLVPAAGAGAGPPPPPAPPTGISPTPGGPMPVESQAQNALPGPGGESGRPAGAPAGMTAAAQARDMNLFLVANATVLRAMERAGKRLLTRGTAGKYPDVPAHELHTQLPRRDSVQVAALLDGAWDQLGELATSVGLGDGADRVRQALEGYCTMLLREQQPHTVAELAAWLRARGLMHGQP